MSCPLNRENVASALMQYGTDFLEETNLFSKAGGNIMQPTEGTSTDAATEAVNNLNNQFNQEPIARFTDEGTVAIYPSNKLVQSYLPTPKITPEHQEVLTAINEYLGDEVLKARGSQVDTEYNPEDSGIDFDPNIEENIPDRTTFVKNWTNGFLDRVGATVSKVNDIVINGKRMGANAVALPLQSLVLHTQDGTVELSEEAMHIAVELISQKNRPLFDSMMEEISSLPIYQEVYDQYSVDPEYQKNGEPDINKIKKEAIGKALDQSIVHNKPIQQPKTWWKQIIDYFKGLFGESGSNLLSLNEAVSVILSDDLGSIRETLLKSEDYLLENGIPEDIAQKIIDLSSSDITDSELRIAVGQLIPPIVYKHSTSHSADRIVNRINENSDKTATLQDGQYTIDGKIVPDGDTQVAERVLFDETEHGEALERIANKQDSSLHKKVNTTLNKFLSNDGFFDESTVPRNEWEQNMWDRLALLPKGSKIFIDKKVAFKGQVLTIDLLSIDPEGRATIWNFDEVNVDVAADERVPSYETRAFRNIVQNQVRALKSIGVTKLGQTRSIPINNFTNQDNTVTITIGDVDVQNEDLDYLSPIPTQTESTSNRSLDSFIAKLNSLHARLSSRVKTAPNQEDIKQQLRGLARSVKSLQVKRDIGPLISQAGLLKAKMESLTQRWENEFRGKDPRESKYQEFMGEITSILQIGDTYRDLGTQFRSIADQSPEFKADVSRLDAASSRMMGAMSDLLRANSLLAEQFAENKLEISNLLSAEKTITYLTRKFRSLSQQTTTALQSLYKMTSSVRGRVDAQVGQEIEVLKDMRQDFQQWMSRNNVSNRTLSDRLFQKGNHKGLKLIDKYDPQFYKDLATAKRKGDINWVNENVDVEAYNEHIKNLQDRQFSEIDKTIYSTQEQLNEEIKEEQKNRFLDTYDLSRGVSKFNDLLQNYPTDQQFSEQYRDMLLPQNAPLLELYNKFISYNDRMAELGLIENFRARTFYPSVRKDLGDKLVFGGRVRVGQDVLARVTVNPEDMEYGKIDENGNLINDIPVYFIENSVSRRDKDGNWDNSEISTDVFSVLSVMNKQINTYELMRDVENAAASIGYAEKNKEALATDTFGDRTTNEDINNTQNYEVYEDFVKATIYGQRNANKGWDVKLGKYVAKSAKKANALLGKQIFSEDYQGHTIALSKAVDTANRWFSMKVLGMNIPVAITNYMGTNMTALIESGKWFRKRELLANQFGIMAGKVTNQKDNKKIMLLDYFLPLVDSESTFIKSKQLNLNRMTSYSIPEALMAIQSISDKPVQWAIGATWLENSMLDENGNLVNIREYLRNTEFSDTYTSGLTQDQRKARKREFEDRVKELKDSKSLLEISEIKDGVLTIPGLKRDSKEVAQFREQMQQIARNATGMGNRDDIRQINRDFIGRSLMMFKNWLPRLVDRRFGEFRYNPGTNDYEVGRVRLMWKHLNVRLLRSIREYRDIATLNDRGVDLLLERYEEVREEWMDSNPGKEFTMTQDQYIEMYSRTIKQGLLEIGTLASLMSALLLLFSGGDDDDFDSHTQKGFWKFSQKVMDKVVNEISFFINPVEWVKIANGGMFPSLAVVTDLAKVTSHISQEGFGLLVQNEDLVEDAKPMKYMMKSLPYTKWLTTFMALFLSDENQKEWGITQQTELGIYQGG